MKGVRFNRQDARVRTNSGIITDYPWLFGVASSIDLMHDNLEVVTLDHPGQCNFVEDFLQRRVDALQKCKPPVVGVGGGFQWQSVVRPEAVKLFARGLSNPQLLEALVTPGWRCVGLVVCCNYGGEKGQLMTIYRPGSHQRFLRGSSLQQLFEPDV